MRTERRLPGLFRRIAGDKEKIDAVSSGQGRAVDSANLYSSAPAMTDESPGGKGYDLAELERRVGRTDGAS
ncbi:hypothetical protein [Streptomyces bicolor]|uniref:hypothetical protein n=1 Tax=Streptomyces bicolor TaxID=66874 RepID=UPI0004E0C168|nr:hypothetical protein [Streptomyces bicolor]